MKKEAEGMANQWDRGGYGRHHGGEGGSPRPDPKK